MLHIGTSSYGASTDAVPAAAAGVARANGSSGNAASIDPYPLHGALPTGPDSAAVYRYSDARVDEARVTALAG
ncbi:hypothetical protein, partial [Escherichia coli]|uniref:hypothetical protein n=1 Tax=Escherichia coli TaxID=562 RepID=UPI003F202C7A